MGQTCEDLYIRNIENAIRGIRLGNKSPEEVNPSIAFEKLRELNFGMHQDLLLKYQNVVNDYKRKKGLTNEIKQSKDN